MNVLIHVYYVELNSCVLVCNVISLFTDAISFIVQTDDLRDENISLKVQLDSHNSVSTVVHESVFCISQCIEGLSVCVYTYL